METSTMHCAVLLCDEHTVLRPLRFPYAYLAIAGTYEQIIIWNLVQLDRVVSALVAKRTISQATADSLKAEGIVEDCATIVRTIGEQKFTDDDYRGLPCTFDVLVGFDASPVPTRFVFGFGILTDIASNNCGMCKGCNSTRSFH